MLRPQSPMTTTTLTTATTFSRATRCHPVHDHLFNACCPTTIVVATFATSSSYAIIMQLESVLHVFLALAVLLFFFGTQCSLNRLSSSVFVSCRGPKVRVVAPGCLTSVVLSASQCQSRSGTQTVAPSLHCRCRQPRPVAQASIRTDDAVQSTSAWCADDCVSRLHGTCAAPGRHEQSLSEFCGSQMQPLPTLLLTVTSGSLHSPGHRPGGLAMQCRQALVGVLGRARHDIIPRSCKS